MKTIVRQQRGCLAWGGAAHLAPVDDILISVERPQSMDSPGRMIAFILSNRISLDELLGNSLRDDFQIAG